jgi:Pyruvate/2-oxoacid:ferredoxin oxidoreductase gamma subunit
MITLYIYGEDADLARRIVGRACSLSGFEVQDFYKDVGYVKIDKLPITSKEITEPDIIILPDKKIPIKTGETGTVLVNSPQKVAYKKGIKSYYIDADKLAGATNSDTYMVMIGALVKVFNKISLKSVKEAIKIEVGEEKISGLEDGFRAVR